MSGSFKNALVAEKPLQLIGVMNAYIALMAQKVGYKALYLSGANVSNASFGLPDLGMTSLNDVLEETQRITNVTKLPLLVDIDTGWGGPLNISKTIKSMIKAGAAAVHIEDQVAEKRCGHRKGKKVVSIEEMTDRIKAAVDAREKDSFLIMARTDAFASEGIEKTLERAHAYQQAGADMLFPEALPTLDLFRFIKSNIDIPVLANLTEFGQTPLFTLQELSSIGIDMALYPLSVNRVMYLSGLKALYDIRHDGSQLSCLPHMQTRDELYEFLNYESYEKILDQKFSKCGSNG